MDFKKSKVLLQRLAAFYIFMAAMIYLVAGDGFKYEPVKGDTASPIAVIGEITDGMVVEQRVRINADSLSALAFQTATFARENTGLLHFRLYQPDGTELSAFDIDISSMADGQIVLCTLPCEIVGKRGEYALVQITSEGCEPGNAVSLYYGNSVKAGRFDIAQKIAAEDLYTVDAVPGAGKLCVSLSGANNLVVYRLYWPVVLTAFMVLELVCRYWWRQMKNGINNPLAMFCTILNRYSFLFRQLVIRDFKIKYKRSVLGVGWSVLNPLLTMSVQYIVFSRLFGNGTRNYPVYLLCGIVFFGFFSEAASMGMTSITGNAALIKKVYVPKYIYPISRVMSSLINLGTSLIPLLAVMLLTGIRPRPALLLLIYDILCFLVFVIGMVLLLSTSMTFFQDTQFLWSVLSMIWMYMTPIFYTENIIPTKILPLYHMNPLYQYITFARTCIIDGVTPGPYAYLWCALCAAVVFAAGVMVFRKNQNKFVLYI